MIYIILGHKRTAAEIMDAEIAFDVRETKASLQAYPFANSSAYFLCEQINKVHLLSRKTTKLHLKLRS